MSCAAPTSNSANSGRGYLEDIVDKTYVGSYVKWGETKWIAVKFWMNGDSLMLHEGKGRTREEALKLDEIPLPVTLNGDEINLGKSYHWKYTVKSKENLTQWTYTPQGGLWLHNCDLVLVK